MMCSLLYLLTVLLCSLPSVHSSIWGWLYSLPNDSATEVAYSRPSHSLEPTVCSQELHCPRGFFCDHHFGSCAIFRQEGEFCRQDAHCARGLNCMFGKCHPIVPSGQEGARCHEDKDCTSDACCARVHGEMVCKRRLHLDEGCYIPQGGIAFSINQVCPCLEGLICRRTPPNKIPSHQRTEKHDWKCQTK
ncbi:dickkopf-related protein 3-like [Hemicordylus capensis]|uniref:dickkopf-related protein 3-like n=1 Tax=Hemicordylus capensis TaxID=884348 RepID=UPI0023047616|nr:dickkopf-related protein 3-like [Hemicordylus capensis]XP_053121961.1 dickkopf-related protein 3-like [Hemicordylus capensis]